MDQYQPPQQPSNQTTSPLAKITENVIHLNTLLLVFLFPLFFLTSTTNFFQFNKLGLLVFATAINLIAWGIHIIATKKIQITTTPFTTPLLVYAIVVLISSFTSSGYVVHQLIGRGALIPAFVITILVTTSIISNKKFITQSIYAMITSATILSIVSIFQSFGFGLSNLLNRLFTTQIPADFSFTPAGSPLAMLAFVGPVLILTLFLAVKIKDNLEKIALFMVSAVLGSSVILGLLYSWPGRDTAPLILPPQTSYIVALETLKDSRTAFFGWGPESYINAFTRSKPVDFNLSEFWNIRFSSAGSELFQIITTTGILGFIAWLSIIVVILKQSKEKLPQHHQIIKLATITFVLLQLILPGTYTLLGGFFFMIMLWGINLKINQHESVRQIKLTSPDVSITHGKNQQPILVVPTITAIIIFLMATTAIYLTGRVYSAEFDFARSLHAAERDDGTATYELQNRAIIKNPYYPRYRRAYSATNLALANSLSIPENEEAEISEEDQILIAELIQQSIREAKAAITLDPQNVVNWESLVLVYRSLIGVAQDADEWTVAALVESIATDPTNPTLRLELGGIYYALGQFDQAIRLFQQATELKPDWANAYYNLHAAHLQKDEPLAAFNYLRQTLAFLDSDTADYTRAREELEALAEEIRPLLEEALAEQEALAEPTGELQTPPTIPEGQTPLELPEESGPQDLGITPTDQESIIGPDETPDQEDE